MKRPRVAGVARAGALLAPRYTVFTRAALCCALAVAALCLIAQTSVASAQSPVNLRLLDLRSTCDGSSTAGTVTVLNQGNAEAAGRVHIFLSYQSSAGGWTRAEAQSAELAPATAGGGALTLPFGPLPISPSTGAAVRVEAVLDQLLPGPAGTLTTIAAVDTLAGEPCAGAPEPGSTLAGTNVQLFDASCTTAAVRGDLRLLDASSLPGANEATLFLSYQEADSSWMRVADSDPLGFRGEFGPGAATSFSYSLPLAGVPADVRVVRAEAEIVTTVLVAGRQTRRIQTAVSAESACPIPPVNETAGTGDTYAIVLGDTFAKLARRWGVTSEAIAAANGLDPKARLKVGQQLVIPPPQPKTTPTTGSGPTRGVPAPSGGSQNTSEPPAPRSTPTKAPLEPTPTRTKTTTPPTRTATQSASAAATSSPAATGAAGASQTGRADPGGTEGNGGGASTMPMFALGFASAGAIAAAGAAAYLVLRRRGDSPRRGPAKAGARRQGGRSTRVPAEREGADKQAPRPQAQTEQPAPAAVPALAAQAAADQPEGGEGENIILGGLDMKVLFGKRSERSRLMEELIGEAEPLAGEDLLDDALHLVGDLRRRSGAA